MKKTIIILFIFLIGLTNLFSQDIFDENKDYSKAILSGEKDLLDYPLDIFRLSQLDNNNLRLLRNMIYARHGYIFKSNDLKIFFNRFGWYIPVSNNVDNFLTRFDKDNIKSIQAFENRNEYVPNITWTSNRVGLWNNGIIAGSGYDNRFVIHSDDKLEFYYSQMRETAYYGMDGTYSIKGNILEFYIDKIITEVRAGNGHGTYDLTYIENTIIPKIYKFPISDIVINDFGEFKRETITIGGKNFYKFTDDVNNKF
jgi:hypothetical protein